MARVVTAPTSATAGIRRQGSLDVLAWPSLDALDVDAFVTTRHGGVSAGPTPRSTSASRRRRGRGRAGEPAPGRRRPRRRPGRLRLRQPGARQPRRGRVRGRPGPRHARRWTTPSRPADALVTADPGTVLAILVADCVPIVLYDPPAHVLACVHAGWRGTVAGVDAGGAGRDAARWAPARTDARRHRPGGRGGPLPGGREVAAAAGRLRRGPRRDPARRTARGGGCSTCPPPTGGSGRGRACRTARSPAAA